MLAFMQFTWLVVWFELGRQPIYNNPDPKQVTGVMSRACLFAFETLAWLTLPSLGLCVWCCWFRWCVPSPDTSGSSHS